MNILSGLPVDRTSLRAARWVTVPSKRRRLEVNELSGMSETEILAVQMQAVITPTLKDCLPKSWMMKVALILLGWIPSAQTLKTPPYTPSNPIHLNTVTCKRQYCRPESGRFKTNFEFL